ncbi:Trp biosynthesis-associated membrane protein [Cryobacterium sp. PH31-AA6]|uniref:Trp biosynthesis-associated membrane protein n=1 Tax=Cryobacterium sp. PH31-AA6 TaxID=3046205 RepID=UPI0024BA7B28|nr:Trp biosynthesis-associated membrane protein [Cryobacterium sp. PH31-AA6]MDJ0322791.1 Trp biosynthesis-associated membrane protein [Cryobacterium sp. PH31-AA6]
MTGRRLKLAVILLVLAASALALLAWTQAWISADVLQSGTTPKSLEVSGSTAAPGLTALALAGIALAGALSIAGPVIRVVLGLLEILLGFSVALSSALALGDPAGASAALVTAATGISGRESVTDGVVATVSTPWPYLALLAGVAMAAAGVLILLTARRWPGNGSRYQAVRFESADSAATPIGTSGEPSVDPSSDAVDTSGEPSADPSSDAVDTWDGLTRGEDPTARR